jgi:adenylate kinase family enzyme
MDEGRLVPDEVVIGMVEDKIHSNQGHQWIYI